MQQCHRNKASIRAECGGSRGGAAMVEAAIVLPIVLLGLLVTLDLGMVVARLNSLSDCARHAARTVVIRGSRANDPLGPSEWSGTLAESHPATIEVRDRLLAMPASGVSMTIAWPDGTNEPGKKVEVSLHFEHSSVLGPWIGVLNLGAQSTMRILH
jgi:Flp pilus assembly protein TadG